MLPSLTLPTTSLLPSYLCIPLDSLTFPPILHSYLQRYSVATESLVLDQSLSEDKRGFLSEMVDLQAYLEQLIEVFFVPMTSCDLTPDPLLVMDLARRMHQTVDELDRDVRGFMGLRQIRRGLLYLISIFSEPTRDTTRS